MKNYMKYLIAVIAVILVAIVFYKKVYIPKTTFSVIQPTQGDIKVDIQGIGSVDAQYIYPITAQSGGKILKILTDNGMWVKKGDLLVVMDGVDLPEQLEIAKANLKKANAEVLVSKNELENQRAQKELLEITYKRFEKLDKQGFATKSEFDKAEADLKSIEASINASYSKIDSAKAGAIIAKKSIDSIKTKIDRLKVYSPVDGYVLSRDAEVAQNVLPQTPVLKIVDPKTLWVATKIDERMSSQIKVGQKAIIRLHSSPEKTYSGVVKRIEPISDAVTLEREVDVAFNTLPKPFYINEQAEVKIAVKSYENVLKIPLHVIVQQNGDLGVWRLKNDKANFIKVEKIAQSDSEMAISNGKKDMKIIVPENTKKPLSDGMKIHL